jgi:hypothetical protein
VHQLNTGNLNPTEIDWASSQLRAWTRRLELEQIPRSLEGFFVDLAGREGLIRRTGNDRGSVLRYLDTTPLADGLERAITALRDAELTDQGPVAAINQQRLSVLRKIQPAVSPTSETNCDATRVSQSPCRPACASVSRVFARTWAHGGGRKQR